MHLNVCDQPVRSGLACSPCRIYFGLAACLSGCKESGLCLLSSPRAAISASGILFCMTIWVEAAYSVIHS